VAVAVAFFPSDQPQSDDPEDASGDAEGYLPRGDRSVVTGAWVTLPSAINTMNIARNSNADAVKQINRKALTPGDSPAPQFGYAVWTDSRDSTPRSDMRFSSEATP
jgi:hypothetical protein